MYQDERPFVSAKKVMSMMGEPYASGVELLSFHTVSKVGVVRAEGLTRRCEKGVTMKGVQKTGKEWGLG